MGVVTTSEEKCGRRRRRSSGKEECCFPNKPFSLPFLKNFLLVGVEVLVLVLVLGGWGVFVCM
jgi:hypothetical protein